MSVSSAERPSGAAGGGGGSGRTSTSNSLNTEADVGLAAAAAVLGFGAPTVHFGASIVAPLAVSVSVEPWSVVAAAVHTWQNKR